MLRTMTSRGTMETRFTRVSRSLSSSTKWVGTPRRSSSRLGKGDQALIVLLPENRLEKGGFSRTVGSDKRDHFPAVDMKIDVTENLVRTNPYRYIFHPEAAGAGTASAGMGYIHCSASFMASILWYMASK